MAQLKAGTTIGGSAAITVETLPNAISTAGTLSVTSTTDATSKTAAPLKSAGGLAVEKKAFVGTDLMVGGGCVINKNLSITGVGDTQVVVRVTVFGTTNTHPILGLLSISGVRGTVGLRFAGLWLLSGLHMSASGSVATEIKFNSAGNDSAPTIGSWTAVSGSGYFDITFPAHAQTTVNVAAQLIGGRSVGTSGEGLKIERITE